MPVSRKRKKRRTSKPSTRATQSRMWSDLDGGFRPEPANPLAALAAYRRQLGARRASLAAESAGPLVAGLVELA
ncbi:MAG TPA: hypothetical protein VFM55_19545, partial [Micromonosporaceae bacterium]|nr:hypothetical protein [Micromonosporaceae bacterium]